MLFEKGAAGTISVDGFAPRAVDRSRQKDAPQAMCHMATKRGVDLRTKSSGSHLAASASVVAQCHVHSCAKHGPVVSGSNFNQEWARACWSWQILRVISASAEASRPHVDMTSVNHLELVANAVIDSRCFQPRLLMVMANRHVVQDHPGKGILTLASRFQTFHLKCVQSSLSTIIKLIASTLAK